MVKYYRKDFNKKDYTEANMSTMLVAWVWW